VLGLKSKDPAEAQVAGAEFILEGLHAHKRIGRKEERVFTGGERPPRRPEPAPGREEPPFRNRRNFN
jgi:magnesium chelatase subunit I